MADALDSGSSVSNNMWVQVPSFAPVKSLDAQVAFGDLLYYSFVFTFISGIFLQRKPIPAASMLYAAVFYFQIYVYVHVEVDIFCEENPSL